MEISLTLQLTQAAAALALGLGCGFLYDLMRAFRRENRLGGVITAAADVLFWTACFFALYLMGLSVGEGRQRIFLALFAALGGAAWLMLPSRLVLPLLRGALAAVRHGMGKLLRLLRPPALAVLKKTKNFLVFPKKLFQSAVQCCRIYYHKCFFRQKRPTRRKHNRTEEIKLEAETVRYSY